MDDMREIVTVEQVNHWFILLAILLPIAGAGVGAILARRSGSVAFGALKGFVVGLLGPLNLIAWTVYNLITDRLGLDTVKNLLVQLALFVLTGAAAGYLIGRYWRDASEVAADGPSSFEGGAPPEGGGSSPVPAAARPPRGAAGAERTFEEAEEPPREP